MPDCCCRDRSYYAIENMLISAETVIGNHTDKGTVSLIYQETPDISEGSTFYRSISMSQPSLKYQCFQPHRNSCLATTVLAHILLFNILETPRHIPDIEDGPL